MSRASWVTLYYALGPGLVLFNVVLPDPTLATPERFQAYRDMVNNGVTVPVELEYKCKLHEDNVLTVSIGFPVGSIDDGKQYTLMMLGRIFLDDAYQLGKNRGVRYRRGRIA